MDWVLSFFVGLSFSYVGSIPPGMININVLQLAMQNKKSAALSFTSAAVLVELVYVVIAVRFQIFLNENTNLTDHFQLISAIVLIGLGFANLLNKRQFIMPSEKGEKRNAFKRGTLISLANPLAIPFWLAVTAYLQTMEWITLEGAYSYYITGIAFGTFLLLSTIILLASKYSIVLNNRFLVYKVPGLIFIAMGGWAFYQWIY